MKALSIKATFQKAKFRVALTARNWQTLFAPLPSAVAGFFGSILGLSRNRLIKFFSDTYLGAKLIKYESIGTELMIGYKFKDYRQRISFNITINFLFRPKFEFIFATDNSKKFNLVKQYLTSKKAIFTPFGGDTDSFLEHIDYDSIIEGDVIYSDKGEGCVSEDDFYNLNIPKGKNFLFSKAPVSAGLQKDFYFSHNAVMILKKKYPTFNGVILHNPTPFLLR